MAHTIFSPSGGQGHPGQQRSTLGILGDDPSATACHHVHLSRIERVIRPDDSGEPSNGEVRERLLGRVLSDHTSQRSVHVEAVEDLLAALHNTRTAIREGHPEAAAPVATTYSRHSFCRGRQVPTGGSLKGRTPELD